MDGAFGHLSVEKKHTYGAKLFVKKLPCIASQKKKKWAFQFMSMEDLNIIQGTILKQERFQPMICIAQSFNPFLKMS